LGADNQKGGKRTVAAGLNGAPAEGGTIAAWREVFSQPGLNRYKQS
jgi:hypothetical protein